MVGDINKLTPQPSHGFCIAITPAPVSPVSEAPVTEIDRRCSRTKIREGLFIPHQVTSNTTGLFTQAEFADCRLYVIQALCHRWKPRPKLAPSTSSGQALSEVERAKLERGTRHLHMPGDSLRRAVDHAVHHPKICSERAHGLAVLVGHNP
jgi:hypothetical protein